MVLRNLLCLHSTIKWVFMISLTNHIPHRIFVNCSRSVVTMEKSESIEFFIDTLMKDKAKKWMYIKETRNRERAGHFIPNTVTCNQKTTCDFSIETVDDYIIKYLNSPDLESIFKLCQKRKILPSSCTLLRAAQTFARAGNVSGISTLILLAKTNNMCDDKRLDEYRVYQAEALWRSGESVGKSLDLLGEVYKNQLGLRRFVRSSLRALIGEVMQCRGEASLVQTKNLVLKLAGPPHEDPVPLTFLWGRCILSESFADQQMANELADIGKRIPMFRRAVRNRVDSMLGEALLSHQVDAVYRLLEALLKLTMYKQSQEVLGKLFDYKYILGDLNGCEAILEACTFLKLDIGSTRRKQLQKRPEKWENDEAAVLNCKSQTKKHIKTAVSTPQYRFIL